MAFRFAVPDQLAAVPLVASLAGNEECELVQDTPARIGVRFAGGDERFDAALITPLDYARHGGSYRVLPGIGVSVRGATGSSRLRIRPEAKSISSLASDLRSTYDLAIATLLLREKYPPLGSQSAPPAIIPVPSTAGVGFEKSDAVLDWFPYPVSRFTQDFALDLHEEWVDLTEAPLVLMMWVVREGVESEPVFRILAEAFQKAIDSLGEVAEAISREKGISELIVKEFFDRHSYGLLHEHIDAIDTLFRVAYSYGMLGDVPDIEFLTPSD